MMIPIHPNPASGERLCLLFVLVTSLNNRRMSQNSIIKFIAHGAHSCSSADNSNNNNKFGLNLVVHSIFLYQHGSITWLSCRLLCACMGRTIHTRSLSSL